MLSRIFGVLFQLVSIQKRVLKVFDRATLDHYYAVVTLLLLSCSSVTPSKLAAVQRAFAEYSQHT